MNVDVNLKSPVEIARELLENKTEQEVKIFCVHCNGWAYYEVGSELCPRCEISNPEARALSAGMAAARTKEP